MPKLKTSFFHPNSRKAQKLSKSLTRLKKLERSKQVRKSKISAKISKFMWFREAVDTSRLFYEPIEVAELIERYLHRHDEELDKITELQTTKGRLSSHYRSQHASREDSVNLLLGGERELFSSTGIELPDLSTTEGFRSFLNWQGETHLLTSLTVKRYRQL